MPESRHEVNMVDVARQAGVSIATVSRALRDLPEVSAATRQRIREIADQLGYVVSPEASRLARRSTDRVAVVVPKIDVWFYSAMLASIEETLRQADFDVLVYQVDGEAQRSRFFQQLPARRKVDAVVLIALPLLPEEESRLGLLGVHVVVAGGQILDFPFVRADDGAATRLAMEHLFSLGHVQIAMLRTSDTEHAAWSSDHIRTHAWSDSLAARGIDVPDEYLVTTAPGAMAGAHGVEQLLRLSHRPTAVLAFSDEIALSAIADLTRNGLSVPADMSVIGIDGHPMGEAFGLTTVSQSVPRQGRLAGQIAIDLLRTETEVDHAVVIDCELIVRTSTAPAA